MDTPATGARPGTPPAIILMGVAGSGKTTVGLIVADRLGYPFRDADEFHPSANVAKMSSGQPLTDDDRWPWLDAIGAALHAAAGKGIVVTCSALKRVYRDRIRTAAGRPVTFVLLDGPRALLAERIGRRTGHFMPASLLDSQLATLERPGPDEGTLILSIEPKPDAIAEAIAQRLHLSPAPR